MNYIVKNSLFQRHIAVVPQRKVWYRRKTLAATHQVMAELWYTESGYTDQWWIVKVM
jgi:hypothetical protein